ncbi:MAG TPA: glycosyltransferase family 9 protein, partial [Bryobacteraceae bacterium]|nr:glycosyltransferase family 9 protein [Bryobacteraceae bacterium]
MTPALELLHGFRPDLEIGVVVEDRFAAVFEGNPVVSAILSPTYGQILRWRPALCLNLHGGTRSHLLTLASLARIKAGFGHFRPVFFYDVKIPRAQEILGVERVTHTAEQLSSAMFHLGVPISEVPRARLFAEPAAAERPYAVIHPTAAMAYKVWPPERFVEVAGRLEQERGLEPVVIGAAGDNLAPFSRYRTMAGAPLGRLKSLLAGASLFVGNDSGPAHIACAFGVPVVVLFGRPDLPAVWSPWRAAAARTLCSPEGIASIQASAVISAIRD